MKGWRWWIYCYGSLRGEAEIKNELPVIGSIIVDTLAILSFFWAPRSGTFWAFSQLQYIALKNSAIEIGEGNCSELLSSKFEINMFFFDDETGDIAKVTEKVVELFWLNTIAIHKPQDRTSHITL